MNRDGHRASERSAGRQEALSDKAEDPLAAPTAEAAAQGAPYLRAILRIVVLLIALYVFFFSIKLMGHSFKLFGKDFAQQLISTTQNPFLGLAIGIFATSLIQSSSTTTSIVVGLVASGGLTLSTAIPIIMGANIGTTITNTIVSVGHITRRHEFERAFASSIVHDFFNVLAVLVLFPIEIKFHLVEQAAGWLEHSFAGVGGTKLFNPLNVIIKPAIGLADRGFSHLPHAHVWMLVLSLLLLFLGLAAMVKILRRLMVKRMESVLSGFLFRTAASSLALGVLITVSVQSSSITTSLVVPLVGAGLLTIRQIFPYVLGANIGTTITAILAALATQNDVAITAGFAHLLFNVFGICILWPVRFIPIRLSEATGRFVVRSRKHMLACLTVYLVLHVVPLALAFL